MIKGLYQIKQHKSPIKKCKIIYDQDYKEFIPNS